MLAVTGESVVSSFVSLNDIHLSNMTNMGVITFGVLINAHFVSIQLSEVEIRSYQASTYGVFDLASSVLHATGLRVYNGTHRNALGMVRLSTVDMRDFIFDRLMSSSGVWYLFSVIGSISHITFTNILGILKSSSIYSTTIIGINWSNLLVNQLEVTFALPGTPVIFSRSSQVLISNSVFKGIIGLSLLSIQSGNLEFRNTTMAFTSARSVFQLLLEAHIEIDLLSLNNLVLTGPIITSSSHSSIHAQDLRLTNVSGVALSKGKEYEVRVDRAVVVGCRIDTLVHFSIKT